jgi:hypothetical protein
MWGNPTCAILIPLRESLNFNYSKGVINRLVPVLQDKIVLRSRESKNHVKIFYSEIKIKTILPFKV